MLATRRWMCDGHVFEVDISDTDKTDFVITTDCGINEAINYIIRAITEKKVVIRDCYIVSVSYSDGPANFCKQFVGHIEAGGAFNPLDKDMFATHVLFYMLKQLVGKNTEYYSKLNKMEDEVLFSIK